MRIIRYLIPLAALALSLAVPAAASAAPTPTPTAYPLPPPALAVSVGTVTVGGSVSIAGAGYRPGEPVNVSVRYESGVVGPAQGVVAIPVGYAPAAAAGAGQGRALVVAAVPALPALPAAAADATGHFRTTVTLRRPGLATITATGAISGVSASVTVTVLTRANPQPVGGGAGGLPITGTGPFVVRIALVGAGVIALGLLVFGTARLRRRGARTHL
jgi:hypothetical protein